MIGSVDVPCLLWILRRWPVPAESIGYSMDVHVDADSDISGSGLEARFQEVGTNVHVPCNL